MKLLLGGIWESHARKYELVPLPWKVHQKLELPIGNEVSKSFSVTILRESTDVQV